MVRHLTKRIRQIELSPDAALNYDQIDLSKVTDEELDVLIEIGSVCEEERSKLQNQLWKRILQKTIVV